jgi:four helix bundle protein
VYKLALRVARWAAVQSFPFSRRHLRDQLVRAADSVVLHIAEGSGCAPFGDSRRNHYRIAAASAAEVAAVLDLVSLPRSAERKEDLRVLVAILTKLARR